MDFICNKRIENRKENCKNNENCEVECIIIIIIVVIVIVVVVDGWERWMVFYYFYVKRLDVLLV